MVGAPGRSSDRGNVWILKLSFASGLALDSFNRINQLDAGLDGQTGARLGSALVAGDFDDDGRDDLAIGAPRYDDNLFSPDTGRDSIMLGANGSALAVGQFNGGSNLDLVVGTPGHDDDSGAVWPLRGQPESVPEETGSREFFTDFLDQEYGVQR